MGRPKLETTKDTTIRFRAEKDLVETIERCCKELNISKSDLIRMGIEMVRQVVDNE